MLRAPYGQPRCCLARAAWLAAATTVALLSPLLAACEQVRLPRLQLGLPLRKPLHARAHDALAPPAGPSVDPRSCCCIAFSGVLVFGSGSTGPNRYYRTVQKNCPNGHIWLALYKSFVHFHLGLLLPPF